MWDSSPTDGVGVLEDKTSRKKSFLARGLSVENSPLCAKACKPTFKRTSGEVGVGICKSVIKKYTF
jgi:hypothetical protein